MKPKHQRLTLLALALTALGGAAALGLSAIGETATYFYAPSDIAERPPPSGDNIRLGGLVAPGSIQRQGDTLAFRVTDNLHTIPVRYAGIAPDLFREGSGVIAEGRLAPGGVFQANTLLAKHDERYMPPEIADSLHKTTTVQ